MGEKLTTKFSSAIKKITSMQTAMTSLIFSNKEKFNISLSLDLLVSQGKKRKEDRRSRIDREVKVTMKNRTRQTQRNISKRIKEKEGGGEIDIDTYT